MVADLEKVIEGLKHCIEKSDSVINKEHGFDCISCPYYRRCDKLGYLIGLPLMKDALELLKEKTVIPHRNYSKLSSFWCECGWYLGKPGDGSVTYCSNCGRKVDWDEAR